MTETQISGATRPPVGDNAPGFTDPRAGPIIAILARETALDPVMLTPSATIDALGVSSLDMTQAIFALESHFDIELPVVPERAGAEFATIGDLVAHVLATLDDPSRARLDPRTPIPAGIADRAR